MSKTLKMLGGVVAAAVLVAGAGCSKGSSPEGKYALDKATMKAQMQAEIDKMPKEEQGMAQMALAFIDMLDVQVVLAEGGKLSMTATAPDLMGQGKGSKTETKEGTWKKEENKILLEVAGEKGLSCTPTANKLECGEGREKMVFIRS